MRPILAVFLVAVVGVAACSGSHEPARGRAMPAAAAPARTDAGLDVPGLLSLTIDEMAQLLGPRLPVPPKLADPTLSPLVQRYQQLDSAVLFRCRGLALMASFNYRTRRVSDVIVLGSNENELMSRARLQLDAANYLVLPVFQQFHPTELFGLRVVRTTLAQ